MNKRIISFVLVALVMSSISLYALTPFHTTPETHNRIVKIAYEVAKRCAPDYDTSELYPMLFVMDCVPPSYINKHRGNTLIAVHFMSDTTSNGYYKRVYYDMKSKKMINDGVMPRSSLSVNIWDTFEPDAIIGDTNDGVIFMPSYEEFLKNNPDFKVKKCAGVTRSIF